jgi:hypothetical protein
VDIDISLDYGLTLLAALLIGTGFVLQQHAAELEPDSRFLSLRLITDLVRTPRWLAGIVAMIGGQILAAWSIGHLTLSVVEPLLTTNLIWALILAVPLAKRARAKQAQAEANGVGGAVPSPLGEEAQGASRGDPSPLGEDPGTWQGSPAQPGRREARRGQQEDFAQPGRREARGVKRGIPRPVGGEARGARRGGLAQPGRWGGPGARRVVPGSPGKGVSGGLPPEPGGRQGGRPPGGKKGKLRAWEVAGAAVLCVGVGLLSAERSTKPIGLSFGSFSHWPAAAAIAAIAVICVQAGRRSQGRTRALLTGIAAGLVYGIQDALTRQTLEVLQSGGISGLFLTWAPYALLGAGAIGIWLMQSAFNAGPIQMSLPAISAGEPLVGILLGIIVFGDRIQVAPLQLGIKAGGIAALVAGVILVARAPALSHLRTWPAPGALSLSSIPHPSIPHPSIPHPNLPGFPHRTGNTAPQEVLRDSDAPAQVRESPSTDIHLHEGTG